MLSNKIKIRVMGKIMAEFQKYQMTKEEFNNRVTELFIEKCGEDEENARDFINNLLRMMITLICYMQTSAIAMMHSAAMYS